MAHGSWGGPGVPAGGTVRITHPRMAGLALNVRREVAPLFQRLVAAGAAAQRIYVFARAQREGRTKTKTPDREDHP